MGSCINNVELLIGFLLFIADSSQIILHAYLAISDIEKSWQSGEFHLKKVKHCTHFLKGKKGVFWGLWTSQPHLYAWKYHETDPPRSCAKAHGGQGGDLGQPAQLLQV